MKKGITIWFLPIDLQWKFDKGITILEAAMDMGIFINARCGGAGSCESCKVIIKKGKANSEESRSTLGQEVYDKGWRLACRTEINEDLVVEIPEESREELGELPGVEHFPPYHSVLSPQYASAVTMEEMVGAWFNPALHKYYVSVDPPTPEDNTSDLTRLLRALKKRHKLDNISVDFLLLKTLCKKLREGDWKVTAVIVQTRVESQLSEFQYRGSRRPKLIQVEPGDTTNTHYSIVFDIGTTSLWGRLLDLKEGKILATSSAFNPQIKYGPDVITRIIFSTKAGGLDTLQKVILEALNKIIDDLIKKAKVERRFISHITAAGNTVMTHMLLGLNPRFVREAPYTPVANFIPPIRAIRVGLNVEDSVYLYTFPTVASYVGGDIVSGVLASGFYRQKDTTLYIDIGTNGEIVLGNIDWLMSASCSAGPAFEGGGVKFGMQASSGAIERFHINPNDFEPMIRTIDGKKPKGICGTGIINILSDLFLSGAVDRNGKIRKDITTKRIREGDSGMEYVIVWAKDTDIGKDIVINEIDIENILRAKAAMFAGYTTLMEKIGLTFSDIKRVIISGAFGDFLNLENAITIGLLPDLPLDRFTFIGNGSLAGAQLISLSNEMLDDGEKIARNMTNVELSENYSFMDHYMASMFLPHTDISLFPTVKEKIEKFSRTEQLQATKP
jgi:uncharacterized 2Fe-2S/4Fe-4S cluster protein (DUF4445 family)